MPIFLILYENKSTVKIIIIGECALIHKGVSHFHLNFFFEVMDSRRKSAPVHNCFLIGEMAAAKGFWWMRCAYPPFGLQCGILSLPDALRLSGLRCYGPTLCNRTSDVGEGFSLPGRPKGRPYIAEAYNSVFGGCAG